MSTEIQQAYVPRLDDHLKIAHRTLNIDAHVHGSIFGGGEYTGARVSLIYATLDHGIHGFVKMSRWRDDEGGEVSTKLSGLSGNIFIPETVLLKLQGIKHDADKVAAVQFKASFGISKTDSPVEIRSDAHNSAILGDFKFPEGKYYSVLWGISENFPIGNEANVREIQQRKYTGCVNTLIKRMSQMEQWLNFYLKQDRFPRKPQPIQYDGLATRNAELTGGAAGLNVSNSLTLPPREQHPLE